MKLENNFQREQLTKQLGYAGLVPFILPALFVQFSHFGLFPVAVGTAQHLLSVYAFGIVAFLCGCWWAFGLIQKQALEAVFGIGVFLLAFFSHVFFSPQEWWLMAGVLLWLLWAAEGRFPAFRDVPRYYREMRLKLTAIASASLWLSTTV